MRRVLLYSTTASLPRPIHTFRTQSFVMFDKHTLMQPPRLHFEQCLCLCNATPLSASWTWCSVLEEINSVLAAAMSRCLLPDERQLAESLFFISVIPNATSPLPTANDAYSLAHTSPPPPPPPPPPTHHPYHKTPVDIGRERGGWTRRESL